VQVTQEAPLPTATSLPTDTPIATSQIAERAQDIPLPLQGNDEIRNLLPGFSLGRRCLRGVRFQIADPPNKLSTQCEANPEWPDQVQIRPDQPIANPEEIYLLINAGYSDEQIGLEVGVIELIFRDQASPAPTRLILGENIREWLLGRGGAMPNGSELREVYRGDTNFQVAGVIDMLRIPIPEAYRQSQLEAILIRDTSRTTNDSRDPCLFVVGATVRSR
jgi:hypothetical protein